MPKIISPETRAKIVEMLRYNTIQNVADYFGLSVSTVHKIKKEAGVEKVPDHERIKDMMPDIIKDRDMGMKVPELCKKYGFGSSVMRVALNDYLGNDIRLVRFFFGEHEDGYCYDEAADCAFYKGKKCTKMKHTRFADTEGRRIPCKEYKSTAAEDRVFGANVRGKCYHNKRDCVSWSKGMCDCLDDSRFVKDGRIAQCPFYRSINHARHFSFTCEQLPSLNELINAERTGAVVGAKLKKKWQKKVEWKIRLNEHVRFDRPVRITYNFYEANRKRDKDNISGFAHKVIQDALVACGILINDGWTWIEGFTDNFYIDKENPRIMVYLDIVEERK